MKTLYQKVFMQEKYIPDNIMKQDNTFNHSKKGLPQFVIITPYGNRQIKIPCVNEAVANRLIAAREANHSKQTAKTTAIA